MAYTYHQQPGIGGNPRTLTVAALRDALAKLDGDLPVIFRSPQTGAYGPNTKYSVDGVLRETLDAKTFHYPACDWVDDETDEDMHRDAYDVHAPARDGVIIT